MTALRVGVLGLVGLAGLAVVWLAARPGTPEGPPTPPARAVDPGNRPILVETGTLPRIRVDPDAEPPVRFGPRATAGEGLGPRRVPGFWMQQHEVTNAEYRSFDPEHEFPIGRGRHPVVDVTWREAMAYAQSLGGRLPNEAEWEFAARGDEGRAYPWGDEKPTCERAHYRDCEPRMTIPAMSRPAGATPEGIHDLGGNVWEWVMPVWFRPGRTPVNDESRRMRGGSYAEDAFFLRATNRNNDFFEGFRWRSVGFRVVWPLDD